jgi:glycosyltransferase involved in cell wall biosynthesis
MTSQRISSRAARVAHVTFGLDIGGQEKLLVEFARHSDRAGFDLRFISLGDRGPLAADIEAAGWHVSSLGAPGGLRPSLIHTLARSFLRWRPDVVHTHDQRALFYAGVAAWLVRVPMIVHTRHGRDVHATPRQAAIFPHLSRLVDRFVCVSQEVAELSREQGIAGSRVSTILNGIDVSRFPFGVPDPTGPVVTVARLSPEKDLANLVRATALAAERVRDFRVEVAGGGPCLGELERLATELRVSDRIAFLGEIRDVPAVLARARMFVLPSRSEGIPLTVLEAMACGLPVIATQVGGLAEVVVDGLTGRLVPPVDPVALAGAMVDVWNDRDLRDRMSHAGRRRAEACFDVRGMVAQYESLYRERTAGDGERQVGLSAMGKQPQLVEYSTAVE